MITDSHADHLAGVASQMVVRVRDDDPADNRRWLHNTLPDPADREALIYVLAAAVPDDQTWLSLTAWAVRDPQPVRRLRPHGTYAAAVRHRSRREPLCGPCTDALRAFWRDRKRQQRTTRKTSLTVVRHTTTHHQEVSA